jgi:ABC-type antimicrobial peptide transport system permease subunit
MLIWTTIKLALKSLYANKLRSFLAMLGIIIGVGAVISMLALGAGAKQNMLDRVSSMGTNLLYLRPGQRRHHGVSSGTHQNLTLEDAEAVLKQISNIKAVAPVVNRGAQLKYFNKNTGTSVIGTTITYFPMRNFEIDKGRAFTEIESERMARVAVLGSETAKKLFEEADPIGEMIKINGINFRVIGVMKEKGDRGWFNPDERAIIPLSTAMKQVLGVANVREIDIQITDKADSKKVIDDIAVLMRKRHRLQPEQDNDFSVRDQADIREMLTSFAKTFTILLGGIASISLLVGGIGIMNIMLVTVTERTREIGVRKAVGAKDRDILRQFLIESLIVSGVGGLLGVALGFGIARIVNMMEFSTVVELQSVILALSVSAAVGIFFGYYPARRAAKLDPIEALRYE